MYICDAGGPKGFKSEIENLELAIFSKQPHSEECSQASLVKFGQKINFL